MHTNIDFALKNRRTVRKQNKLSKFDSKKLTKMIVGFVEALYSPPTADILRQKILKSLLILQESTLKCHFLDS